MVAMGMPDSAIYMAERGQCRVTASRAEHRRGGGGGVSVRVG